MPGERVTYIRFTEQPGKAIRKPAYRLTTDLRNALDQAMHAASVTVGTCYPKQTNFPSGDNLKDFESNLTSVKSRFRGIPAIFHDKLKRLQIFPFDPKSGKGNRLLFGLFTLANDNKHRIPLKAAIDYSRFGVNEMIDCEFHIETQEEGNLIILRTIPTGKNPSLKGIVEAFVTFTDVFAGDEVCGIFQDLVKITARIVFGLEWETERILAAR